MKRALVFFATMLVTAGCGISGCEVDRCEHAEAPRFLIENEPVAGPVRFPSPGSITVTVLSETDENKEVSPITVEGLVASSVLLDESPRAWTATNRVEVRSALAWEAGGAIVAKDGCGRTARLELEGIPVASVRAVAEVDEWIAALPAELKSGGVSLLAGLPFLIHYEVFDAEGEPLPGHASRFVVDVTGGIELTHGRDRVLSAVVVGPDGPATITMVGNSPPLAFEVASGDEATRLVVWRNARTDRGWLDGWVQGEPIGEELVVAVGESVTVGLHPFDADGRLLIGIDTDREPLEIDSGASFVEARRGYFAGDAVLTGVAPGETTVVASKAGATTAFHLRVVEGEAP